MTCTDAEPTAREALIDAMAACCAEQGYESTAVADVARRAGLPAGAFNQHFAGKAECAVAAVEAILAEGMAAVGEGYAADRSEWESVLTSLRILLDLFASRPALARLAFVDSRQSLPPSGLALYESGFAILTAMLDRLRGERVDASPVPSTAARAAIGGGEALVRRELAAGRAASLSATLPALVYTATVAFLGQAEALRLMRQAQRLEANGLLGG